MSMYIRKGWLVWTRG